MCETLAIFWFLLVYAFLTHITWFGNSLIWKILLFDSKKKTLYKCIEILSVFLHHTAA